MHADCALEPAAAAVLAQHLHACADCRAAAEALRGERACLASALQQEEAVLIPKLQRPMAPRHLLGIAAAAACLSFAVALAWLDIAGSRLPEPFAWLNPFGADGLLDLCVGLVAWLAQGGGAALAGIAETAALTAIAALAGAAVLFAAWPRSVAPVLLAAALAAIIAPLPGHALELRRSDQLLTIPEDETIDDTLLAAGDSIAIDGTVNGDVLAAAKRVVVRGHITGLLITGAESVVIQGRVDGSTAAFGREVDLTGAQLGRNIYAFGQHVTLGPTGVVAANAVVFGQSADIGGSVGRDVVGFGSSVEISGPVAGNVTAFGETVTILGPARIGGNVVAHVPDESALRVASDATVTGNVSTRIEGPRHGPAAKKPAATVGGYVVRFAAAFIAGAFVLWLLPLLRTAHLENGTDALISGGVGLLTLVAVPIASIIVAITIIGLPIAFVAIVLWIAAVYFAKILLAYFLGKTILSMRLDGPHFVLALAVGLVLVFILISVPFIGGVLSFLFTIVGLGMIVEQLWRHFHRSPAGSIA
jgi:cytoskeletal protein CcmA (bactofilin family)/predicted anti-sigma-YlaC factor YlaD